MKTLSDVRVRYRVNLNEISLVIVLERLFLFPADEVLIPVPPRSLDGAVVHVRGQVRREF